MNLNRTTPSHTPLWVIIGATGFVGRRLLAAMAARPRVRVLVHRTGLATVPGSKVEMAEGDLLRPETLKGLVEPGCVVINLAYLSTRPPRDNLTAMANLAEICRQAGVGRLIHCSTAVVAGRTGRTAVDENTTCRPVTAYEKVKLKIEELLLSRGHGFFEVVILRPTAVFGPGGQNLLKLADSLTKGNSLRNYLKSCLFNRRSMNLVCLDNVVAALVFLADRREDSDGQIFIISDDDSPVNNYRDVESRLIERLRLVGYRFPRIALPVFILRALLRLAGRSADPEVRYNAGKIVGLGFNKPCTLQNGLDEFANWYRREESSAIAENSL